MTTQQEGDEPVIPVAGEVTSPPAGEGQAGSITRVDWRAGGQKVESGPGSNLYTCLLTAHLTTKERDEYAAAIVGVVLPTSRKANP